jgi:fumarate reductase subunit C
MILSGWKAANERQTVITSWFIGISAILLVLYLTEPKPNADKEWFDYYFEAIAVILLIVSLLLYLLSATYLLKPFYQDDEPTKEQLMQSAVHTRRVQIPGVFMIFWAIGFLILLKLEYSSAVLAYSMVAFGAPIVWLGLRRIAQMKF